MSSTKMDGDSIFFSSSLPIGIGPLTHVRTYRYIKKLNIEVYIQCSSGSSFTKFSWKFLSKADSSEDAYSG